MPRRNTRKRKFIGFIAAGFFFTMVLYIEKASAAPKTHQSPFENDSEKRLLILPLVNNNNTPTTQMTIPRILIKLILSFKNIRARITDMIGEEVVPMRARLIASE